MQSARVQDDKLIWQSNDVDNLRYHLGPGLEVANLYPQLHERGFYEGMRSEGETDVITLCRSAWAGSQRYGAAVWSGDIPSTPYFRELIVRWFQYGVFCPLFRLHGVRAPEANGSGAPNEVWSFGDEAYAIIKDLLFLRERLRPYIMEQVQVAHEQGLPPMRPLWVDFPEDKACLDVDDEFMFGPSLLVAPVVEQGAASRRVYLPAGTTWTDAWTGIEIEGGQMLTADTPLDKIPLYLRGEARLPIHAE